MRSVGKYSSQNKLGCQCLADVYLTVLRIMKKGIRTTIWEDYIIASNKDYNWFEMIYRANKPVCASFFLWAALILGVDCWASTKHHGFDGFEVFMEICKLTVFEMVSYNTKYDA